MQVQASKPSAQMMEQVRSTLGPQSVNSRDRDRPARRLVLSTESRETHDERRTSSPEAERVAQAGPRLQQSNNTGRRCLRRWASAAIYCALPTSMNPRRRLPTLLPRATSPPREGAEPGPMLQSTPLPPKRPMVSNACNSTRHKPPLYLLYGRAMAETTR